MWQSRTSYCAFVGYCVPKARKIAAYGAAAKGNTLLNFAGIRPDLCL
ncbi:MAG: hypothetical protein R3D29_06155 [Nitratireductor sp.]